MIIYWNDESNYFIKSIMTAGTNCPIIFCSHVKHCARETFRIHSKWTLPVRWDWGVIQWGLSVGLHHPDTHYVKKLHHSDLSHTRQSGRQTWHLFTDRTLRRGCDVPVCHADLIHELYRKSVPVVQRWMLRVKRSWCQRFVSGIAALYWRHTEHTQPAVILGFCRMQEQKTLI